jgi:hypothetical protein
VREELTSKEEDQSHEGCPAHEPPQEPACFGSAAAVSISVIAGRSIAYAGWRNLDVWHRTAAIGHPLALIEVSPSVAKLSGLGRNDGERRGIGISSPWR